ncbi:hypothetical protein NE237_032362 [Protea cynaroides]|uniref:Uncharacterized protein n=1 Tax=Protea cynaroides TaxID=273540 RepID=A0A9Q0R3G6_9MAGN|nr:hypothetical protein NE237_032362 [Protea cynaroides]
MHQLCNLQDWSLHSQPRHIFDTIIFSNELEFLEIRWHELMPYVSKFGKIVYGVIPGRIAKPSSHENPFNLNSEQYGSMNALIHTNGIPSMNTMKLLQWCEGILSKMHLQFRRCMFSFEFPVDFNGWRATVNIYNPRTNYGHYRWSILILYDAGWHCSFCFRHIQEFILKMTAYKRIQKMICTRDDLFDMLLEEYSFQELIKKLDNVDKFRCLLPGGCLQRSNMTEIENLRQFSFFD